MKRTKKNDSARLDWLQNNSARVLFEAEDECSIPHAKVYIPKLGIMPNEDDGWECIGEGDDYRDAIDCAMGHMAREIEADNEVQRAVHENKMTTEEALDIADSGDRTTDDPLAILAAEVRRLRGLHVRLQNHEGAIILQHSDERGSRHEALSLKYRNWPSQPARALGANYGMWEGNEGRDYMEIHWPDKYPLQLILRPDEGELFGFIKIEQTACNHWRLLRA